MNEERLVQRKGVVQSELMVFQNEQFGTIRTVNRDGEPWFVGRDVAVALGYSNSGDALLAHVDSEDKQIIQKSEITTFEIPNRGLTIINESGLYSLILSSKLKSAKTFKSWITHDVIPSIRKHGAYMTRSVLEQLMEDPNGIVLLAQQLLAEREEKLAVQSKLEAAQPKADYYDAFVSEDSTTSIRNTAKELGVPQNIFVRALIASGYLYRDRRGILLPYARYAESGSGLFRVRDVYRPNGEVFQWTLITPKGKDYFRKELSS